MTTTAPRGGKKNQTPRRPGLRGLGEDRVVATLLRGLPSGENVIAGPGDDCAVIGRRADKTWTLLKTDCVIEGVHFEPDAAPGKIGWKALARAVSDIAAMGGLPRHALITLAIPPERGMPWLQALYAGVKKCAARFGVGIVGGETARSPGPLFISVALAGFVEKGRCALRSGGRAGDAVFVTGRLGGSIRGRHLTFIPRIGEARWLTENFRIRAMMDLSDGLGADLPRLARASRCGCEIDREKLPLNKGCTSENALGDGEDYELLFTVAARDAARLATGWRAHFPKLPLTRIGSLSQRSASRNPQPHGFDHFA